MKLGISPLAEQDIEAIGDYIAQDNPGVRLENGKYPTLSLFFVQTTIH